MYLFFAGGFFRRRRRGRARDEMPTGPLVEVLLFWVLFGLAALLGSVALVGGYATFTAPGGPRALETAALALCALAAVASLAGAIVYWRRLLR